MVSFPVRGASFALLLFLSPGCSCLSHTIVAPQNHGRVVAADTAPRDAWLVAHGIDQHIRVPVEDPEASIAVWIVEPDTREEARGTVLVLHGVVDGPLWVLEKGRALARHGYRAAIVAHRGYADSSGAYRTFGVVEKRDLTQVVDALEARGLVDGKVGVWGLSYGATVALEFAGHDSRVGAVVAVAGFSSMRSIVPHFTRVFIPVAWLITDDAFDVMVDAGAAEAGFDPDDANAARAVERTDAAILLVHGEWDAIVPFEHAETILAHAPPGAELVALPMTGHVGAWLDFGGRVRRLSNEWFDRWLPGAPRPG